MTIKSNIKQLIEEIQNAAETMMPIEDLHVGRELKRMAREIELADDVMLANTVSDKVKVRLLIRAAFDRSEKPIILCDIDKKVLYANRAAVAKYASDGAELVGLNADGLGIELSEVKDDTDHMIGFINA